MLQPAILVVDDDTRLRELLTRYLTEQGFNVTAAKDAAEARQLLKEKPFDLMVLDVMMPGESGLELAKSLPFPHPPILLLSAMGEAIDRINGLETGAQDYLTKPFEPRELVLRIQSILRRFEPGRKPQAVSFGPYHYDLESSRLTRGDETLYLTSGEAAILKLLADHLGQAVSREELARATLAPGNERSVDVQITRLRKKIEEQDKPAYIQTIRHAGYALVGVLI